jgi:hypothetical protein
MPGLLIKNVPLKLTRRLRMLAVRHHRSMTREALTILEEGVERHEGVEAFKPPQPLKMNFPLTNDFINRAKRSGRA